MILVHVENVCLLEYLCILGRNLYIYMHDYERCVIVCIEEEYDEKEDPNQEDRQHKREAGNILKEEKRSFQEGSGAVNSL